MNTSRSRTRSEIIATLAVASVLGTAGLWVFARKAPPVPESYRAIVVDASLTSNPTSRCEDLGRLADEAAQQSVGKLHLTVFATGDRPSGFEPTRLGTVEYQSGTRILEGAAADEESRQAFLADVKKLCPQIPIARKVPSSVRSAPR